MKKYKCKTVLCLSLSLLIVLFALTNIFNLPQPLDTQLFYNLPDLINFKNRLSTEKHKNIFLVFYFVDFIWPVVYTILGLCLLQSFKKDFKRIYEISTVVLLLIPVLDYLENIFIILYIKNIFLFSFLPKLTLLKWIFIFGFIILLLLLKTKSILSSKMQKN